MHCFALGRSSYVSLLSDRSLAHVSLWMTPVAGKPLAWHGIIVPITFIISLFSDTVGIYEVSNNGGWYDFGFLIGASLFLGGGGAGARGARADDQPGAAWVNHTDDPV